YAVRVHAPSDGSRSVGSFGPRRQEIERVRQQIEPYRPTPFRGRPCRDHDGHAVADFAITHVVYTRKELPRLRNVWQRDTPFHGSDTIRTVAVKNPWALRGRVRRIRYRYARRTHQRLQDVTRPRHDSIRAAKHYRKRSCYYRHRRWRRPRAFEMEVIRPFQSFIEYLILGPQNTLPKTNRRALRSCRFSRPPSFSYTSYLCRRHL